ncbi:endo-1,4-beta-xylanase [Saccharophagus degradans]|uniref:Beta-xylanase n=1 Tax=Saccharophagus degradans (strain 2-40 / ATCC 43961 / DSM 17024) TaxID=203122 RepID=Q21HD6_SACD2|nr:endo-1,4-beta-xylanase [Saccharophagus degradans]ABD81893.1 putative xylanase [Saccharophagus degradans 2-40]
MNCTRRNIVKAGLLGSAFVALPAVARALPGLATKFRDQFYVGTAVSARSLNTPSGAFAATVAHQFNALTAENAMKPALLQPQMGEWRWQDADAIVRFAEQHQMLMHGHTLVWHSQTPDWFFQNKQGEPADKATLYRRQEEYINAVVGRYKGRVHSWDVVNEAEDEGKGWRKSHWYNICGPEFMERAFRLAHAADPKAHLCYNDYNMHLPQKREFLVKLFKDYIKRGVPIHGVGLQGHVGLDYPSLDELEKTIVAMADLGLKVHITELDVDVLPAPWQLASADISTKFEYDKSLNPYVDGLPDAVNQQLSARYVELFKLFIKHQQHIGRVTFWGVGDGDSWKNNFPVPGRTNYPLLFDRNLKPKPAYNALVALKL